MSLTVLCSILYDCQLLPYFLRYYTEKGVDRFIFSVWDKKESRLWSTVEDACRGFNATFIECISVPFNGEADANTHNSIRTKLVKSGHWYVICDLDEFHDLKGCPNFLESIEIAEHHGGEAIHGLLWDRVSLDGYIPPNLDAGISLGRQFPLACNITGALLGAARSKILMAKKEIAIRPGHHKCQALCWLNGGTVHHVKWFGHVMEEAERRIVSYQKQGLYYKDEPRRLLNFIKQHRRFPIDDPLLKAALLKYDPLSNLMCDGGLIPKKWM
jgi:hypothetical protein